MNTNNETVTIKVGFLKTQITELMSEAETIVRNLTLNPDLVPDRIEALDRVGRLAGAAKKLRKATVILSEASHKHWKADRIIGEAERILSTVSY